MTDVAHDQDVVRFIREQHADIRRLFADVAATVGDRRHESFECLVRLLAVHETAEEEIVYPVVRSADPVGDEVADARTAEESEAKRLLADLERLGPDSDEFLGRLAELREAVLHHANEEERTVLPLLARTQDDAARDRMARAAQVAETLAPTHPHPHGPESAVGNLLVGPLVAVVDRTRDALRRFTR